MQNRFVGAEDMAAAALAALKAAAADCFAAQAGFGPGEAVAGVLVADELRALFFPLVRGRAPAPSAERHRRPRFEPAEWSRL